MGLRSVATGRQGVTQPAAITRLANPPLPAGAASRRDWPVLAFAAAGAAIVTGLLLRDGAEGSAGVFAVAMALGAVFLASEFGYTAAIRAWIVRGDGANLAAGLIPIAVAALVIVPMTQLAPGYSGFVSPIGVPLILGAAIFGVGMQLANGCGSGTLYTAGGGSRRLWAALPFFCLGGVLGTLILPAALELPSFGTVDLGALAGPWGGTLATLAMVAALAAVLLRRGRFPARGKVAAGLAIGVLAALAFGLSGQPWGITMGLTVWGGKILSLLGFDLSHTTFWSWDGPKQALAASVLQSDSSLMDIGLILGAAAVAGWRGSFRGQRWPDMQGIVAACIGGLLMGIGARLAFGCNIGAFMSGLASGSLHGLVWLIAALPGCWLGIKLRPAFGLAV